MTLYNLSTYLIPQLYPPSPILIADIELTPRQFDIVAAFYALNKPQLVASLLGISNKGVAAHIYNIKQKLPPGQKDITRCLDTCSSDIRKTVENHYRYLLVESALQDVLRNLKSQAGKHILSCQWDSTDAFPQDFPLLHIHNHLKSAGIEIISSHNQGAKILQAKQVLFSEAQHYYTALISLLSTIFIEQKHQSDFQDFLKKQEDIFGGEPSPPKVSSSDSETIYTFQDHPWFELIKTLATNPHYRVHRYIGGVILSLLLTIFGKLLFSSAPSSQYIVGNVNRVSSQHQSSSIQAQNVEKIVIETTQTSGNKREEIGQLKEVCLSSWNLPLFSDYYVDREELGEKIWNYFSTQHSSENIMKILGLTGPGGIGKTYFAMNLIHFPKQPYKFRAWFNADNETLLKTQFFDLGNTLRLFVADMTDSQKISVVKKWMESQQKSLIVYDGAPDLETLTPFLPNSSHIIITSRNYKIQPMIEVPEMTEKEALYLLKKTIPQNLTQSESIKLVQKLHHFPLAISQAAAYITENTISISNYINLYSSDRAALLSMRSSSLVNAHQALYITWDMNIVSLIEKKDGKLALDLLNFISFCYSQKIPKLLLKKFLCNRCKNANEIKLNELLGLLRQFSLIKVSDENISIHSLIAQWAREKVTNDQFIFYIKEIKKIIEDLYPQKTELKEKFDSDISKEDYILINLLFPHIDAVIKRAGDILTLREKIQIFRIYINALLSTNNINKSNYYLKKLLYLKEKYFGCQNIELIQTLLNLALTYQRLGEYHQAEGILRRALDINIGYWGKTHSTNIPILNELSIVYHCLGDGLQSKKFLEKALLISKNEKRMNTPQAIETYFLYARTLALLGNYYESKNVLDRVLKFYRQYYGEGHLKTLHALHLFGWLAYTLGDINNGKALLEVAHSMFLKNVKLFDARAYNKTLLGFVYYDLENWDTSTQYFQEALAIRKQIYGKGHIWTIFSMVNLALVYASHQKIFECKKLLNESLSVIERNFSTHTVWSFFLLNRIALCYLILGDYYASQDFLRRALAGIKRIYGKDNIFTAIATQNLGNLYRLIGNKKRAHKILKESLQIIQKTYGRNHPATAKAIANLALVYTCKKKDELLKEALDIFKKFYAPCHTNIKRINVELGKKAPYSYLFNSSEEDANKGYIIMLPL